jgi:hypothetical protein
MESKTVNDASSSEKDGNGIMRPLWMLKRHITVNSWLRFKIACSASGFTNYDSLVEELLTELTPQQLDDFESGKTIKDCCKKQLWRIPGITFLWPA